VARPRRPPEPEAIAAYKEWIANRYNPGYYLGGRIPPYWRRRSWNRRGRRREGWVLIVSGLAMFIGLWTWMATAGVSLQWIGIVSLAYAGLYVAAGVRLLSTPGKPRGRTRQLKRADGAD
jgi:hypothetical protein